MAEKNIDEKEKKEMEFPTIKEIIKGLAQDLLVAENPENKLTNDDLREAIANLIANQMIIFNLLNSELGVESLPIPKGLYS